MSFASEVKEEVARLELDDRCQKAELAASLKLLSSISFTSRGMNLTARSKNALVIRTIARQIQNLYDVKPVLAAIKDEKFNKSNTYALRVTERVREILEDVDLWTENGLQTHPRMKFFTGDSMIRAYIAGCFMSTGSINPPGVTNYHLEMSFQDEDHGSFVIKLLQRYRIAAKLTRRRNSYVLYVKVAEQIGDFLRLISASNALFRFEDMRIQRDFINNLSRLNNCEIANEEKSLKAARTQYEAIEYLIASNNLVKLSDRDQEMAMLRYQNPEASLMELSELYEASTGTVLSKSGVRHRFNKIIELADKYRGREAQ